jgi:hypothetical protein
MFNNRHKQLCVYLYRLFLSLTFRVFVHDAVISTDNDRSKRDRGQYLGPMQR